MTPQEKKMLEEVHAFMQSMKNYGSLPYDVDQAMKRRLDPHYLAQGDMPLAAVTAPSGGMTVDSEARTAINSVITRLESAGILQEN